MINVVTPLVNTKRTINIRSTRSNQQTTIIIYIERKKNHHPLFAGIIYLVFEDFSIGNEEDVSIIDSSYCSPSSLCFSSTNKTRVLFSFEYS